MTGYTGYDNIIEQVTVNDKFYERWGWKQITSPEAASIWHSCWREPGIPGAGADPATTPGTQYDDTAGSVFLPDQASALKVLLASQMVAGLQCTVMLYDRLVAVSGLSLASTGNKTVSSAALTRYTDGIGVECWLEVTTATTTTAPVVTLNSYTDPDDNTGQTGAAVTFPAAATNVNTFVPLSLAASDIGLKAVSTINVGTAAAAGVCNLVLLRPIAFFGVLPAIATVQDEVVNIPSLPKIYDGATLAFAVMVNATTSFQMHYGLTVGYN